MAKIARIVDNVGKQLQAKLGLLVTSAGTIATGVNLLVTVVTLRAPGMGWAKDHSAWKPAWITGYCRTYKRRRLWNYNDY